MEKVGVAAVVEGLSSFLGDMGKMDDSIRKLISPTNILGSVFGTLGNILEGIGSFVVNTLAHALGELLADAIQWVVTQIKELISATIEAGKEFQTLSLRLNTLNFNDLTESEKQYSNASDIAIQKTQEQLNWLQKLAAQTPYDNTDISNIYTLARGYSFADKDARGLVNTIIDFTSGMGLGNTEMVRIIKNLGQMQQLGKVTQRELNDLAVGAFVPVNKVLEKMRIETGLAGDEFIAFRNSGAGVESFLRNFTALVEGDFGGSAQKMARTFGAATDNLKDFIKSVFGLNVVKPILDVLGGRVADFMDELTSEDRWNSIVGIADRIGASLSGIIDFIIGLAPNASGMADAVVDALEGIADWIDLHRNDIVGFILVIVNGFHNELLPAIQLAWGWLFGDEHEQGKGRIREFGEWLQGDFLPFIQREVIPGVEKLFEAIFGSHEEGQFTKWTDTPEQNGKTTEDSSPLEKVVLAVSSLATALPSVLELFGAIGGAIMAAFGGDDSQTFAEFVTGTLIPAIESLTAFVKDNEKAFAFLFKSLIALEIIAFIVGLVFSFITALAGLLVGLSILGLMMKAWEVLKAVVVGAVALMIGLFGQLGVSLDILAAWFWDLRSNVIITFNAIITAIRNKDWVGAGKAVVTGILRGILNNWNAVISAISNLAQQALNTFYSIFNINSPSQEMFDIGKMIVKGLAKGVTDSAGVAVKAMANTASAVLAAASPQMAYSMATTAPSQSTYQNTNNFNATFNSNTRSEPLLSDFSMMQSLVGG